MIKRVVFLTIVMLFMQEVQAQLKTKYFLLAYVERRINSSCVETEVLNDNEIELSFSEGQGYVGREVQKIRNEKTVNYNYPRVELVPYGMAILYYSMSQTKPDPVKTGQTCVSVSYSFFTTKTINEAKEKFAKLERKAGVTYKEEGSWYSK